MTSSGRRRFAASRAEGPSLNAVTSYPSALDACSTSRRTAGLLSILKRQEATQVTKIVKLFRSQSKLAKVPLFVKETCYLSSVLTSQRRVLTIFSQRRLSFASPVYASSQGAYI